MATYYVNASGSNTSPFDTPAKGATKFSNLPSIVTGDIVEVVDNGEIVEDTNWVLTGGSRWGVIIRSWSGNSSKPTIRIQDTNESLRVEGAHWYDLRIYHASSPGSPQGVIVDAREVQRCEIWTGSASGSGVYFQLSTGMSNIKIKNNIIYNCTYAIDLLGGSKTAEVFNNTCYNCTGFGVIRWNNPSGHINVYNNIVAFGGATYSIRSIGSGTSTVDFNNVYSSGPYGGISPGPNSLTADPLFVNAPGGDFKLGPGSPCVDSGAGTGVNAESPTDDYRSGSRPIDISGYTNVDNGTDMGAYEMTVAELDTVPPTWFPGYPSVSNIGTSTLDVLARTNENGVAYFVVVPDGETAPSSAQVKAGQDYMGNPVASGFYGSTALTANVEASVGASNLSPGTNYDVYAVAEDGVPNLQASPSKVDVLTAFLPVNNFSLSSVVKGSPVTSTIDSSSLVQRIQYVGTDTYFDSTSEIASVEVRYTHEDGRQRAVILHNGPNLQGQISWAAVARDGTWQKDRIETHDAQGARNTLIRDQIGINEDIVMTDGTMALNT